MLGQSQPVRIDLPDELLGPRVRLRPYDEADAPRLWQAIDSSREHLAAWLPWVGTYGTPDDARAEARRLRARWLLRDDLVVGIFDRASGELLGGSGLSRIDWQIRRFEIGYWLRQSALGHGYITEAVEVLTRFAFDQLGAQRVLIRMDARNTRSRAVPERLGFVYEGCLRNELADVHGNPRPIDVFALIPEDYARVSWRTQRSERAP
ncbi:MAG: GNAT family N-acetyltransferase [Chloroflexota bacterium]|nr:GNAT family N-acetyltransferase [Chloroflexota bacterium]